MMNPGPGRDDDIPVRRGNFFHVGEIVRNNQSGDEGAVVAVTRVYSDWYTLASSGRQLIQFPGRGGEWFYADDFTAVPQVCPTCGKAP